MPHKNHDRLSLTDAVFLYLERDGVPLHIAGVSAMEGIVSLEDCRRFVESKIPQIPRYRQRVVAPLFNIGRPTWEFDPEFDIANHIQEVSLKHGTDAEFKALSAKILSEVMDRRRPLWDITLVRGLKGNRTGFISRVHHCLADGMSGVGLMNVILDVKPSAPPAPGKRHRFRIPPPRDPWAATLDGWISSYTTVVEQVLTTQADILNIAERLLAGRGIPDVDDLRKHLPELSVPTEPLHFNATCRGPQNVAWVEIPLADIKAVREACGCSINDVALALLTATIRRYAARYGDRVKGKLLRIMVPVNTRGDSGTDGLGNQVSILPVTIPLDIEDPKKLVAAVHERTSFLKRSYVAELASLAGGLIGMLPAAWQALGGPIAAQLPITPFNLVCTNVPGPPCALYLMGHKMLNWHPYVPIGGDMALNCAILSYNGTVYFGFTGDAHAAPGIAQLETLIKKSMQELQKALGIKARRKTVVRRKPAVAEPAAAQVQTEEIKLPAAIAVAVSKPPAEQEGSSEEPELVRAQVA